MEIQGAQISQNIQWNIILFRKGGNPVTSYNMDEP